MMEINSVRRKREGWRESEIISAIDKDKEGERRGKIAKERQEYRE